MAETTLLPPPHWDEASQARQQYTTSQQSHGSQYYQERPQPPVQPPHSYMQSHMQPQSHTQQHMQPQSYLQPYMPESGDDITVGSFADKYKWIIIGGLVLAVICILVWWFFFAKKSPNADIEKAEEDKDIRANEEAQAQLRANIIRRRAIEEQRALAAAERNKQPQQPESSPVQPLQQSQPPQPPAQEESPQSTPLQVYKQGNYTPTLNIIEEAVVEFNPAATTNAAPPSATTPPRAQIENKPLPASRGLKVKATGKKKKINE